MRAVADTNVVVSGLLWGGLPRQVLNLARERRLELFTSTALLAELAEVLERPKFFKRLNLAKASPRELVLGYAALAKLVLPAEVLPIIDNDPDDDEVLACAAAAEASVIVSGDRHLVELGSYRGIQVLTAQQIVRQLEERSDAPREGKVG